jgi:hypothetical protein
MKRTLALILALTLVLVSCGGNTNTTSSGDGTTLSTSSEDIVQVDYGTVVSTGKTAKASVSAENMPSSHLTDGADTNVWSTGACDTNMTEWIVLDLGDNFDVKKVDIKWEMSAAKSYKIELSRGGYEYTEVKDENGVLITPTTARFVKITLNGADAQYSKNFGVIIKEIEVYGNVSEDKTMGNEKVWDSDYVIDTAKQKAANDKYNAMQKFEVTRVARDTYDHLGVNKTVIEDLKKRAFDGFDYYHLGEEGIVIADITIDAGLGEDVTIVQLSDLHISTVNDKDIQENNASLLYTAGKYKTMATAQIQKELEYAEFADRVVITGDTLSYLSHGGVEAMNKYIWDKYPYHIITSGNHDSTQVMGGVAELLTPAERMKWINNVWKHDYEYVSTVVKDKVMIVAVDNATQFADGGYSFAYGTAQKLEKDIEIAKQNGYKILLFTHVPLYTANPNETDVLCHFVGDWQNRNDEGQKRYIYDFSTNYATATGKNPADKSSSAGFVGSPNMSKDGENAKVFALLRANADTIKGVFTGHSHGAFYTEIMCDDGKVIPQYTMNGGFYTFGTATKITVK